MNVHVKRSLASGVIWAAFAPTLVLGWVPWWYAFVYVVAAGLFGAIAEMIGEGLS